MPKRVFFAGLLVVALIAGGWSVPAAQATAMAQPKLDVTSACDHASTELVGRSADLPRIKGLIHDLCDFRVRMSDIPSNVSEFDKDFIEDAITSNTLELQSLKIALDGATNEEWRGQLMMMIDMHTSDLEQAIAVAKKIGADTKPDLTHASVYPETPDYDLGKRSENLVEKYLDPLMAAAPGGPTAVPSGVPTDTATGVPTGMATDTATALPTGMATATGLPTDMVTATGTSAAITTYDDADPAWTYTGGWLTYNNPTGPMNGISHYTNEQNASASINFSGTQFTLFYSQDPNRGDVEVWIDGTQQTTFSENGPALAWQQTWTLPTPLSNGTHTLQLRNPNTSIDTYIDIDAIQIMGSAQPVGTGTATPIDTSSPTLVPTDTPTFVPTDTPTLVPTDTPTFVLTDTPTLVPTDTATATAVPTDTGTAIASETATGLPSETPTGIASETPTPVPGGGGTLSSFEILSMHIIQSEHVADVQTELAAERLVKNDEIRAFAKHSADVTELHIMLMDDLHHRLVDNITPPAPEFQADYQSPRRFEAR